MTSLFTKDEIEDEEGIEVEFNREGESEEDEEGEIAYMAYSDIKKVEVNLANYYFLHEYIWETIIKYFPARYMVT